ncbi:MAG: hypothetical protein HOV68_32340 [Streptomycetaceae bacterium]|nr:hypothetical protein [Streptomycetaceae bacterium]
MGVPRRGSGQDPDGRSLRSDLAFWYNQAKNTLLRALLGTALAVSLIAQFVPPVGDYLSDNLRFGVAALLVGVTFILLDALTAAPAAGPATDDSIVIRQTHGIRPYIKNAFQARTVTVDFAGFTGETLSGLVTEFLQEIEAGQLSPKRVVIRILVPDPGQPMVLPCNTADLSDNPAYRLSIRRNMHENAERIVDHVRRLQRLYPEREYLAEVRTHRFVPLVKMFIINESMVFWGYYPVEARRLRNSEGTGEVYDLRGFKTRMFGVRSERGREVDRHQVYVANEWFATMWAVMGTAYDIS